MSWNLMRKKINFLIPFGLLCNVLLVFPLLHMCTNPINKLNWIRFLKIWNSLLIINNSSERNPFWKEKKIWENKISFESNYRRVINLHVRRLNLNFLNWYFHHRRTQIHRVKTFIYTKQNSNGTKKSFFFFFFKLTNG